MVAPAIPVSASHKNLHSCSLERSPKSVGVSCHVRLLVPDEGESDTGL